LKAVHQLIISAAAARDPRSFHSFVAATKKVTQRTQGRQTDPKKQRKDGPAAPGPKGCA
jgi:hypothetical protein